MTRSPVKESAINFLTLVASGNIHSAYQQYVGPGFRHHNPHFRGDVESLRAAMEENAKMAPGKILEVKQALQDGDRVATFSWIRQQPEEIGWAVVHIFRFEHGKIVELWDVGQAIPAESPNENGMF